MKQEALTKLSDLGHRSGHAMRPSWADAGKKARPNGDM